MEHSPLEIPQQLDVSPTGQTMENDDIPMKARSKGAGVENMLFRNIPQSIILPKMK
jgi:hypothetical protein